MQNTNYLKSKPHAICLNKHGVRTTYEDRVQSVTQV